MSKTAPPPEGHPFASSPAHAAFRRVEELFLELRGAPLTLNPDDWQLSREWFSQGMDTDWLLETLREIFERREEKGTADSIVGLRSVRRSIEAAWKRQRELQAPAQTPAVPQIDSRARLEEIVQNLPKNLPGRAAFAVRIRALRGDVEALEDALEAMEPEVLRAAEHGLTATEKAELSAQTEAAFAVLASRLREEERVRARRRIFDQLLRERADLPSFTIF